MLIVNADDWGRSKAATDRAHACYLQKRISSTTAMVFMEDSTRAANLANECGIPTGLHLNFTQEFSSPATPPVLRQAHAQVSRYLRANKFALILYHPFLRQQSRLLFRAQWEEFQKLFGRLPDHLDGHQHMHLSSNMLLDGIIPRSTKVRRSFSFAAGEKGILQRAYRKVVDSYLAPRYQITDYFFALAHHIPPRKMLPLLALAQTHSVEVMAHPELTIDYDALMSDEYAKLLEGVPLGSYSEL